MAFKCRKCGAVGSHLTFQCGRTTSRVTSYTPLVTEVDRRWRDTERDLADPGYTEWLEGPHDLVMRVLEQLKFSCDLLGHDIELSGAEKELMHCGWRHGPYLQNPAEPQATWKKWRLKMQTQGDGRVCFKRDRMAIHFEDTEGELRTLNAKKFFTKHTPDMNQINHITNAIKDSPEWKRLPIPRDYTRAQELAKRVLEVFPEVQYRREGDVKVFVRGKRQRDDDVYAFIEEELHGGTRANNEASASVASVSTVFEGMARDHDNSRRMPLVSIPDDLDGAVSDIWRTVSVLQLSSPLGDVRARLLASDLARQAEDHGIEVEPAWARGAKIFVHMRAEDLPEVDLRPYHVVVYEEDIQQVVDILQSLRSKRRPQIKSSPAFNLQCPGNHESDAEPSFVIVNTFIHIPEPRWISPRSKYTHSYNDAHAGNVNPRSLVSQSEDNYAKVKVCHSNLDLPGALQCYSTMSKSGTVGVQVLTMIIDICSKTGALEEAERLMIETMKEHKVQPSSVTFNCLIHGYATSGNSSGAKKWFDEMVTAGMEPKLLTYNCVIRAFASERDVHEAEMWFQGAKKRFPSLDATTFRTMMELFAREGLTNKVENCLTEMYSAGLPPSRHAFNFVICAHANARDLASARLWSDKGVDAGFAPDVSTYTHLLRACAPGRDKPADAEEGSAIFVKQVAAGIMPNHSNLQALADALGQRAARLLCEELHVHTRAANLPWWPDRRDFVKPPRLASQVLATPSRQGKGSAAS